MRIVKSIDCYGTDVEQVIRLLIFSKEEHFKSAISENKNICPIFGDTSEEKELFPNLYIAGMIREEENEGHSQKAI